MIVEFAGCTGAGKSTFASAVAKRLSAEGQTVADHTSRGSSVVVSGLNVFRTLRVLPTLVTRSQRSDAVLKVVWRAMDGRARNRAWRTMRMASVVRRVGDQRIRLRDPHALYMVDEGPLGVLDLALGSLQPVTRPQVDEIVEALDLSHVIVWIDAPLHTLIERTLERPDSPRELRKLPAPLLADRLRNSRQIFELAFKSHALGSLTIPVANPNCGNRELEAAIEEVTRLVRIRLTQS